MASMKIKKKVFEAVESGNLFDLADLVEAHPHCIFLRDDQGNRPLHIAAKHGRSEVITWLSKYNINFNQVNSDGYSPLHIACDLGFIDCVMALKLGGANIDEPTFEEGYRPLHLAARKGNHPLCMLLAVEGCCPTEIDLEGHTPIHYAETGNFQDVANFLKNYLPDEPKPDKAADTSKQDSKASQGTHSTSSRDSKAGQATHTSSRDAKAGQGAHSTSSRDSKAGQATYTSSQESKSGQATHTSSRDSKAGQATDTSSRDSKLGPATGAIPDKSK